MRNATIPLLICISLGLPNTTLYGQIDIEAKDKEIYKEHHLIGLVALNRNYYVFPSRYWLAVKNRHSGVVEILGLSNIEAKVGVDIIDINDSDILAVQYSKLGDTAVYLYDLRSPSSATPRVQNWEIHETLPGFTKDIFIHRNQNIVGIAYDGGIKIYSLVEESSSPVEIQSIEGLGEFKDVDAAGDYFVVNYGEYFELFKQTDGIYRRVKHQKCDIAGAHDNADNIRMTIGYSGEIYIMMLWEIWQYDPNGYKLNYVRVMRRDNIAPLPDYMLYCEYDKISVSGEYALFPVYDASGGAWVGYKNPYCYILHIPTSRWIALIKVENTIWPKAIINQLWRSTPYKAYALWSNNRGSFDVFTSVSEIATKGNTIMEACDYHAFYSEQTVKVSVKSNSKKGSVMVTGDVVLPGDGTTIIATAKEGNIVRSVIINGKKLKGVRSKGSIVYDLKNVTKDINVKASFGPASAELMKTARDVPEMWNIDTSKGSWLFGLKYYKNPRARYLIPGVYAGFCSSSILIFDVKKKSVSESMRELPYGVIYQSIAK